MNRLLVTLLLGLLLLDPVPSRFSGSGLPHHVSAHIQSPAAEDPERLQATQSRPLPLSPTRVEPIDGLSRPIAGSRGLALAAPSPPDPRIARIAFGSDAELALLATRLDIWEVHRNAAGSGGAIVARVTDTQVAWLQAEGFVIQAAPLTPAMEDVGPAAIPGYDCYRTVDELYAQLTAWAAEAPALTELRAIGTSYEGRPLLTMRLTNETTGLDKPVFFLIANIHGRELITPETAMAFIARLLDAYGRDPDVTWLLDHQVIEVLVSANPDGHVRNERGASTFGWRKNTNPTHGWCGESGYGVDLNRNSSWHWGGAGSSSYPCDEVYRGPEAASEVETQALEAFLRTHYPDRRPPNTVTPAPDDTSGLFITLHSYGNLVLWPWGDVTAPAPNGEALARLGHKLAGFNAYTAQQSIHLYPTTGATDDFAYGELGIAAYTFEIGTDDDGFYPPCSRAPALIEPNLDALLYAAKVTRAPYLLPAGPDVLDVTAETGVVAGASVVTVTARIDDSTGGGQPIAAATLTLDLPPWAGGTPLALSPTDGAFDSATETVDAAFSAGALTPERHMAFVQGQDAEGTWGPVSAAFVTVTHGLGISPTFRQQRSQPGETVTHVLTITGTHTAPQTLTLEVTGATWPTTLVPTTATLQPGGGVPITVTVVIPPGEPDPTSDRVTLTVRIDDVPWPTARATVETLALEPQAHLPLIMRGAQQGDTQ